MGRCGKGLSRMPVTEYPLKYPLLVVVATVAATASKGSHQRGKPWHKYLTCEQVCPWTWHWQARKSPSDWFWPLNTGPVASLEAEMSSFWPRKGLPHLWEEYHIPPGKWEEEQTQPCTPEPPSASAANSQSHCHFTNIYRPLFLPNTQGRGAGKKTENLSTQGRQLAGIFSRKTVLEKHHYEHQPKMG